MKAKHCGLIVCLWLFFFFVVLPLKSQDFQTGFVITEQGDTLHGYIKDRKAEPFGKLYSKIKFKSSETRRKRYSPNDIKAYKCGNALFRSVWIETESDFLISSIMSAPYHGKKQFVRILAEGELSLWYMEYEDESGIQGQTYFKRTENYYLQPLRSGIFGTNRKQLADFFSGCPELAEKILSKELSDAYEILDFYNSRCSN